MKRIACLLTTVLATMLLALSAATSQATTFTVQDLGISPGRVANISVSGFYSGRVRAGINNLVVDGVAMNGFCIDPFHFSLNSSPGYRYMPLTGAPKPPGTMNAFQAGEISSLWAMVYSPTMTRKQAAGMQIAIWEIVGGDSFTATGKRFGAYRMLRRLQSYTGPSADLIALSGPGQDYVVQNPGGGGGEGTPPPVPEGGSTLGFLAFATIALALFPRVWILSLDNQRAVARARR